MKARIKFPRIARPSWLRRAKRSPRPQQAPHVHGPVLRTSRVAALCVIAVLIVAADAAAFAESYRGLFLWATHHGLSGFWAAAFPLQVDTFIAVGELALFIAMVDQWTRWERCGAWAVALLGAAVSVAGNVGHATGHDIQSRGTAAVPPLAAFAAMWVGLGILKRVIVRADNRAERDPADAEDARDPAGREPEPGPLAELADAVRLLAQQAAGAVRAPAPDGGQGAVLGELLEAIRGLGGQAGDTVSSPVPADAESAALIAMRATLAAGNPLSGRQLETRFGLTRAQVTRVREAAGALEPESIRYASAMNGAADTETSRTS
jgi:hypothetical protein